MFRSELDERARMVDELADGPEPDQHAKLEARLREFAVADEKTLAICVVQQKVSPLQRKMSPL